jgi:response regulator RpfG family c-di-GMP phosphodiesterase
MNDAMDTVLEALYDALQPVIEQRHMTADEAAEYLADKLDELIRRLAVTHPDVAERLLAAIARDLD